MVGVLPPVRTICVAALLSLVVAPAADAWTWPAAGPVLRQFQLGADPYAGGQHRGIAVGGAEGEAVLAPRSGTVSFAGSVPTYGLSVTITTDDGYSVTLVHLGSIAVKRNSSVVEGAAVGTIGPPAAEIPGPYVHLGVRLAADPNGYLDPLRFLPLRPAPEEVPLPSSDSEPEPAPASAPSPSSVPKPSVPKPPTPQPAAPGLDRSQAISGRAPRRRDGSCRADRHRAGARNPSRSAPDGRAAGPVRCRARHGG
jgi:Peptidase family M23